MLFSGFAEEEHPQFLDGAHGVADKFAGIVAVPENVDLFPVDLPDNCLDPDALDADAGSDRINGPVRRIDSDLGPVTGFPDNPLDLDNIVVDLRNLDFKEVADKLGTPAGQDNPGSAVIFFDTVEIRLDAFTNLEFFAGRLVTPGHDALGLAEIDKVHPVFLALDISINDLALAMDVLVIDDIALDLPQFLRDDLPCGLGCNSAEFIDGKGNQDLVSDVRFGFKCPCRFQIDIKTGCRSSTISFRANMRISPVSSSNLTTTFSSV